MKIYPITTAVGSYLKYQCILDIYFRFLHYFHSKIYVKRTVFKSNKNLGICSLWGWKTGYDALIASPTRTNSIASVKTEGHT